jgi:hypothetical protein
VRMPEAVTLLQVILTFYSDIPEPLFVISFLQNVCCPSLALWAMSSLHISLLMQRKTNQSEAVGTTVRYSTVTGRMEVGNYFHRFTRKRSQCAMSEPLGADVPLKPHSSQQ